MKIIITAEHIDIGLRNSTTNCPIALAVRELLPDHVVSVGGEEFHTWPSFDAAEMDTFILPEEATRFIVTFDNGRPVEPFSFEAVKEPGPSPTNKKVKK